MRLESPGLFTMMALSLNSTVFTDAMSCHGDFFSPLLRLAQQSYAGPAMAVEKVTKKISLLYYYSLYYAPAKTCKNLLATFVSPAHFRCIIINNKAHCQHD
eukprot:g59146.t1